MKKKNNLLIAFIALIALLSFGSCKKVQNDLGTVNKEKTTSVFDHIKSLGYKDSEIKDIGDDYLVDGDIMFSKKAIIESKPASTSKLSVNQYGTQNYLGLNTHVLILVDPSMNGYINEINSAVAQWNAVPNCRVKFAISNASLYNLVITANTSLDACGRAYFPINGNPGALVEINNTNSNQVGVLPSAQLQSVIVHELGHAIGLRHTNWLANGELEAGTTAQGAHFTATNILGTPAGSDPASIMNGSTCGTAATVLSNYDKIAVQYIYPQNAPIAGTVPVFRYYFAGGLDHFYTTDYNELAQGSNNGYTFEGVGFFAFPNQVAGSVPVYRYYNDNVVDHFYTPNPNTPGGYTLERIAFYAYTGGINGSSPVYRYYHGGAGVQIDHFYTKNQNEILLVNGGSWSLEDIHFYAY